MLYISEIIDRFFTYIKDNNIEVYNEFSLQHEMGIFLRNNINGYVVQFERNIRFFDIQNKTIKKEIDIVIYNSSKTEKYAIELKFPVNGQYPEQMYSFVKDLSFMEELKKEGFTNTFSVVLVKDKPFYFGKDNPNIYEYFRAKKLITGKIFKPTGSLKNIDYIEIFGEYNIDWKAIDNIHKYYSITI